MKRPITVLVVPGEKLVKYLLDLTSRDGKSKAKFFLAHGFTLDAPKALADALNLHTRMPTSSAAHVTTEYGGKMVFRGPTPMPDGMILNVLAVWKYEEGSDTATLVTARPDRGWVPPVPG